METEVVTNGNETHTEDNPEVNSGKHDDFFDEAPRKASLVNEDTGTETQLTNGHVENGHDTNTKGDEVAQAHQEQETDENTESTPVVNGDEAAENGEEKSDNEERKEETTDQQEEESTTQEEQKEATEETAAQTGDDQNPEPVQERETPQPPVQVEEEEPQNNEDGHKKAEDTEEESHPPDSYAVEVETEQKEEEKNETENLDVNPEAEPRIASRESDYNDDFSLNSTEVVQQQDTQKAEDTDQQQHDKGEDNRPSDVAVVVDAGDHEDASTPVTENDDAGGKDDLQEGDVARVASPQTSGHSIEAREAVETPWGQVDKDVDDDAEDDSRADAASVVPVPVVNNRSDSRSSGVMDEQGDIARGEDRTEEPAPEGTEDSRGQGQWKTEAQQAAAAAVIASKTDREAMEEAFQERDQMRMDLDNMQIKDFQERLAILARENEEKDKRIFKLENDLKEANTKLRDTERKLFASEANSSQREAPKSKTCTIM